MKYVHFFSNVSSYNNERTNNYIEPWVSYTQGDIMNYNKSEDEKPLTFEIISDGNIVWKTNDASFVKKIEYKKNDGEWTNITPSTGGTSFSVQSGDTVQFRGNNSAYGLGGSYYVNFNGTTCGFNLKGNILSLLYNNTMSSTAYIFPMLFDSCTGLTNASKLILPETVMPNCYQAMFYNCSNLVQAPELPATTLVANCYQAMFNSCTSLNYIKCLATNISANMCTYFWTNNVASSGTFVKAAGMNDWPTGTNGIPTNWTVQDAS